MLYATKDTELENGLTLVFFYLSFFTLKQIMRSRKNQGWIAVFPDDAVIYWQKQRFKMVKPPFLTPFVVILCLKSINRNHTITLLIFAPQMSAKSWRVLHFILQGLMVQSKEKRLSTHLNRFD